MSEEIQQILLEKNYLTIAEGNFIIDLDEFLEQVGEIMVINYIPGNEIGSQSFFSDNNEELFLGFELKHRGPLSLCLKQFLKSYTKK